ncbi:MAG: TIGR02466 family protein [Bdellovibrio sp.]|jgi:uncharacterized protein (TIGR02466 family)
MPSKAVFKSVLYQAPAVKRTSRLFRALLKEVSQIEAADTQGEDWSAQNYPNGYTSYGSWDRLHLMSPYFLELKTILDQHAHAYVKDLAWDVRPREIQLTRLWVNVMRQNTLHGGHLHPLSVVSGTFYLQTPKDGSAIKFEDPRFTQFMGRPPIKAAAKDAQSFLTLQPRAGEVILFESWMRHEVPLHRSQTPRISVSFNYDWVR